MGVNNTATLGGAQIGGVGGGTSAYDISEGKNASVAGGPISNIAGGSNATSLDFGALEGNGNSIGPITFNQESPAAIAALQAATQGALQTAQFVVAQQGAATNKALETAAEATAPTSAAFFKIALVVGAVVVVYALIQSGALRHAN